ncbi:MAG: peptidase S41 [Sphingobacteriales bacterium]|nr:peptidase S41 [Sphingobacteriales bacterium]
MRRILILGCSILFAACGVNRSSFSPVKKYAPDQLQRDYDLYRGILELHHPSLYWYTPKDSMDYYFDYGRKQLADSLAEPDFRKILAYVTAKINCGHTSIRNSRAWSKYSDTVRAGKMFPLSMKLWNDTMLITANLNRKDSILRRGTQVTKLDGKTVPQLTDTLFRYISSDGYNRTHKYQTLSNRGYFGALYTLLYGPSEKYELEYADSTGTTRQITIPVYNPAADTAGRIALRPPAKIPQPSKRERKRQAISTIRLLRIDTVNHSAMMTLSTFGRGFGLRKFFRQSFRALREKGITHLIVDVRGNGGGNVNTSTLLTKYITDKPFKLADSLYAVRKHSPYYKYIQNHSWNKLFISFFTHKKKDGYYHFGYFERHYFNPKKSNHFNGKTYIVTGGNSFSATTLFTSALLKQENVLVVGEETGGGAYGNTAWLIPDVTLPETGVRFRLPLFRLVIDKNNIRNGRGVQPEITSFPSVEAIRRNADFKIETVMELIRLDQARQKNP